MPTRFFSQYRLLFPPISTQTVKSLQRKTPPGRYIIGYFKTRAEALEALSDYRKNPIGEVRDKTLKTIYEEWSSRHYKDLDKSTINDYRAGWKRLQALQDYQIRLIKKTNYRTLWKI